MWLQAPALAAAVSVAAAVAARPPVASEPATARWYESAARATEAALVGDPVVVAFGELHQTAATRAVPSALRRFTEEILPVIAARLSHLVVETWVTTGGCGASERAVTADVARTTERPATTESEIEALIRAAASRGISPRILSIGCADYAAMRPPSGDGEDVVDYDRVLRITAAALESAALRALAERAARTAREAHGAVEDSPARARPTVAVYGGALHNDVAPDPELGSYSFAPALLRATLGRTLEVDLVVPEYAVALRNAGVTGQPWWRAYLKARRPGGVVLVRRGSRSFTIVFDRTPAVGAPAGSR
jgi:hypothetical protein